MQGFLVHPQLFAAALQGVQVLFQLRLLGAFVAGDGAHEPLGDVVRAQVGAQRQDEGVQAGAVPRAVERGERGAGLAEHQDAAAAVHERADRGDHGVHRGGAHGCSDHEALTLFGEVHDLLLIGVQVREQQLLGGVALVETGCLIGQGAHDW